MVAVARCALSPRVAREFSRSVSLGEDYDALNRLVREDVSTSAAGGDYVKEYTLDLVGNRAKLTVTKEGQSPVETTSTYDERDRLLTEVTGADAIAYGYDANGSLTTKTANGVLQSRQVWDLRNRLTELRDGSDALLASYRYAPDGIRSEVTEDGTTVKYVIDALSPSGYAQVVEEWSSGGGGSPILLASYVYGTGLDPISVVKDLDGLSGLEAALYLADGHSGVRQLVDGSGVIQAAMQYDAFGASVAKVGPWANANVIGYRGERFDSTLGQYYLRARYYDPQSGRFTGVDPYAGTYGDPSQAMRYGYAGLNPIGAGDPSGQFLLGFTIGVAFGAFNAYTAHAIGVQDVGGWAGAFYGGMVGGYSGFLGALLDAVFEGPDAMQNTEALNVRLLFGTVTGATLGMIAGSSISPRIKLVVFGFVTAGSLGAIPANVADMNSDQLGFQAGSILSALITGLRLALRTPSVPGAARPQLRDPFTGEPIPLDVIPGRVNPAFPAPRAPSNEAMGGVSFPEWGRSRIQWGTGPADALDRINTVTPAELHAAGVTSDQVLQARDFYRAVYRRNPGNPSAAARVQLMEHILTMLP